MKQYKEAQIVIVRLSSNIITNSPGGRNFQVNSNIGDGEFAPDRREIEDYDY